MPAPLMPGPPRRLAALATVAVAVLLAGCGSTGASGPAVGSPSSPPSAPAASVSSPTTAPSIGAPSGSSIASRPFDPGGLRVALQEVASGLDSPLAIVNAGDGSNRLFVVEQGGRIRIVTDGTLEHAPFLDIAERITSGGERGLLGLAFHPRFPADPR